MSLPFLSPKTTHLKVRFDNFDHFEINLTWMMLFKVIFKCFSTDFIQKNDFRLLFKSHTLILIGGHFVFDWFCKSLIKLIEINLRTSDPYSFCDGQKPSDHILLGSSFKNNIFEFILDDEDIFIVTHCFDSRVFQRNEWNFFFFCLDFMICQIIMMQA